MAVVSNIHKYMVDGVEIPVYPTSVVPSDNLVSKSWNDMNGVFKDIPVNLKAKVNWVFDVVSDKDLEILYGQMIRQRIIDSKSRFFSINTKFPGVGYISGTFYLGTPTTFTSLDWQSDCGDVNFWRVELHWIEVDGIRLNSPLAVVPTTLAEDIIVNGKTVTLGQEDNITEVLNNSVEG